MRLHGLIVFAVLMFSCTPRPPVPPVVPTTDAGSDVTDTEPTSADACARLKALHCPAAETTPGGATCLDVFANIQDSGIVALDLSCVVRARTCAEADACQNVVK